jgi:O-methyltransferase involved in polyketide biosynthesis
MTRTGHDSWDLRSSVGTTGTMVVAARAVASRQPQAIINDPWAAPLVEAVGIKPLTCMVELGMRPADETLAPEKDVRRHADSGACLLPSLSEVIYRMCCTETSPRATE